MYQLPAHIHSSLAHHYLLHFFQEYPYKDNKDLRVQLTFMAFPERVILLGSFELILTHVTEQRGTFLIRISVGTQTSSLRFSGFLQSLHSCIVTRLVKAGIMEQKRTTVTRQRRDKHISAETSEHEITKELWKRCFLCFSSGVACLPEP